MKTKKNNLYPILYIAALLIIFFMHILMLDKLPRGLNVDEVGSAIDAYSLGHFGVDRWMKSWPIYFKNYGDGQNALYTYLLVPVMLINGSSIYAVRSIIILSAFVMAVYGAKTIKIIYDSKNAELSFMFLFAIMPVFTIMLRFGLESHLMMSVTAASIYYLVKAVKTEKNSSFIALGISSGLILWTYAIAYIVVPMYLLMALIYLIIKKQVRFINFLSVVIPFSILSFPLAVEQWINRFDLPELKVGIFTFTKLVRYRDKEIMTTDFFIKILHGLKSTILFDSLTYNSVPYFSNFYFISVPFILIGIGYSFFSLVKSFKKGEKISLYAFPLFYWIAYTLFSGFMANSIGYVNLTRMNGILASIILFVYFGIKCTINFIKTEKVKTVFIYALGGVYTLSFLAFAIFYFTKFDSFAYPYKWLFYEPYDAELFNYLDDPGNGYTENTVYLPWNYNYYLWAMKLNPLDLQLDPDAFGSGGITEIGRYRTDGGVNLNSEYVFYYSEYQNIDYFRNQLHFNEYDTDHFVLFLDPLHDISFFDDNHVLGNTEHGDVIITKSYISDVGNNMMSFYGWITLPDDFGENVKIYIENEYGFLDAEILSDSSESDRTICFQVTLDYPAFSACNTRVFHLEGIDQNGNCVNNISSDMTK